MFVLNLFILILGTLANFSYCQQNSDVFSQYFGAATVTAVFAKESSQYGSEFAEARTSVFKLCTNFGHGLNNPAAMPTGARSQIMQVNADGVCQVCTSLSIARIESCCSAATSVACFDQFAPGKAVAATATSTSAGSTASVGPAATKSSGGNSLVNGNVALFATFIATLLSLAMS